MEKENYALEAIKAARDPKPNWREAFERTLEFGGAQAGFDDCVFCNIAHVTSGSTHNCIDCPLATKGGFAGGGWCVPVLGITIGNSERRAICRHVLAPGMINDWTDVDEIRSRIAEMLDDEQREKFLGKAPTKYTVRKNWGGYEGWAQYVIVEGCVKNMQRIIAACRDKDTAEKVAGFLNNER